MSFMRRAIAKLATDDLVRRPPPNFRCPEKNELQFKPQQSQWRYIGKGENQRTTSATYCTGKADFGLDAQSRGHGLRRRSNILPCSVAMSSLIDEKARSAGQRSKADYYRSKTFNCRPCIFQPLGGVAVIADNTWAAFQGRKKLNVCLGQRRECRLQLGSI